MKQQTAIYFLEKQLINQGRILPEHFLKAKEMEKLSTQNKINILETLLLIIENDHPEFKEENTTGWDVIENAKIWLEELK